MSADIPNPPPTPQASTLQPGWQQYTFCIILNLVFPLLPLIIEKIVTNEVKIGSITLTAALYAIGVGVSSKNLALFAIALLQGVLFSVFYGVTTGSADLKHPDLLWYAPAVGMGLMFVVHGFERYNRHVRLREPFPDFLRG